MNRRFYSILMVCCVLSGLTLSGTHLLSHAVEYQHDTTHCDSDAALTHHYTTHSHQHSVPGDHEKHDETTCELCLLIQQFAGGWDDPGQITIIEPNTNGYSITEHFNAYHVFEIHTQRPRGPPITV